MSKLRRTLNVKETRRSEEETWVPYEAYATTVIENRLRTLFPKQTKTLTKSKSITLL